MRSMVQEIEAAFREHGDPELAAGMKKYMKNRFEFHGIKSPLRKLILREIVPSFPKMSKDEWKELVDALWQKPEREYQYAACDISNRYLKLLTPADCDFILSLIRKKSWWDTVDHLASNFLGAALKNDGLKAAELAHRWIKDDDMWVRRSALIFQLKYGSKTNFELIEKLILQTCSETDFFMRKAAGWALRQHSKTDQQAVADFITENKSKLSTLTIREGSKYLEG